MKYNIVNQSIQVYWSYELQLSNSLKIKHTKDTWQLLDELTS